METPRESFRLVQSSRARALNHPLLDQLDSSLSDLVAGESVEFRGEWSTSSRRTYKSEAQIGTGSGPFRDVVDSRWRGALTSSGPITGIAFLLTADTLYWVKAANASLTLPVEVSLHAYAGHTTEGATFTASLASAYLPGLRIPGSADLTGACALGSSVLTTGRVTCLARANSAAFLVLLIQRGLLYVGRNRLWRLRDDIASSLPAGIRDLLTRRRTGVVHAESPSAPS